MAAAGGEGGAKSPRQPPASPAGAKAPGVPRASATTLYRRRARQFEMLVEGSDGIRPVCNVAANRPTGEHHHA